MGELREPDRKSVGVSLRARKYYRRKMDKFIISADVGGSSVKMGLFKVVNEEGKDLDLVHKFQVPTKINKDDPKKQILDDIADAIKDLINKNDFGLKRENLFGIGLGIPGPVLEKVIAVQAVNIGWKSPTDLKEELMKRIDDDIVVYATNDAVVTSPPPPPSPSTRQARTRPAPPEAHACRDPWHRR